MSQLILRPSADYSGSNNYYKQVDDVVSDGSTTTVFAYALGSADMRYTFYIPNHNSLIHGGTINKITVVAVCSGIDGDYATPFIRIGGANYGYNSNQNMSSGWQSYSAEWTTNPDTSLAWTWNDIDNLFIGVRLQALCSLYVRCTQLYVVVDYDSIPFVDTDAATNVEETTATGNGEITDVGVENADKRGICYNTTGNPLVTDDKEEDTGGSYAAGTFSKALTGLTPATKYYYRAYAHNSKGYGYGDVVTFMTKPNPPTGLACTVVDDSQINLTWTKGTGAEKTKIIRKVGSYPTSVADGDEVYFGTGNSYSDTGLDRVTHYYYRAWSYKTGAPNSGYSDVYSSDDDTTLAQYPTITINNATDILSDEFTANATISDDGGVLIDERGFQYGLTKVATWNNTESLGSYEEGDFDLAIESLSSNTYYWIRAFATNARGTTYTDWIAVETAASGDTPSNTLITLTGDISGYVSQLHGDENNDLDYPYDAYFVIATDLSESNSLVFKKRLLDLFNYFRTEDAGDITVSIKCDHETTWREIGTLSLTGDDDVVLPHLAPDELGRHFLIKFMGNNVFRYLGTIFKFIVQGER